VRAELVADAHARLGEGPLWDARTGELLWVDILAGVVHRFDPETGGDRAFEAGSMVGAVVPRARGGYVLADAAGFSFATDGGEVRTLATVGHGEDVRMNDGACDGAGRFWAGSMRLDEASGGGCLYRLDPDHGVRTVCEGVTISNGIAWSPDETLMYYVDTPTSALDVFDFDVATGAATCRRTLATVDGHPDGLVVDAEGFLWVAFWGGGRVRRYSPEGEVAEVIEVPVAHTTKAAFGGEDLRDLYITTAAGEEPHAGGLFVAQPGVAGLPAGAYAG
jgi:sugar lactone lactonase YvrE